ncbi:sensor histidine kinase [Anaerosporobacter faecicola]|uniref:sensor histidine kinase n=1 Tax=Anaerosporobacter faecicola TaxID=2718714 RepID=UPI00143971D3|nr:HAMP domain-containing sensor histidine kinase [Anaerosporobacter faecicola]
MKVYEFLKDKVLVIILNFSGYLALSLYLYMCGFPLQGILLIGGCHGGILLCSLVYTYIKRTKYMSVLLKNLEALDKKYLLTDVWKQPQTYEDQLYYTILRRCNKSMLEEILKQKHVHEEYQEYIEQWVHEVKTPIAAMKLLVENGKEQEVNSQRAIFRKLLLELEHMEHDVEQVLYYARSEAVAKDYLIRETDLHEIVNQAIRDNKQLLIQSGVSVESSCHAFVIADRKWVAYILSQCIQNAVAYESTTITFSIKTEGVHTTLYMEDNGVGIKEEELPRIFEKGFTGTNGRVNEKSTGIGLYICSHLCDKMNIQIKVVSQEGKGSIFSFTF